MKIFGFEIRLCTSGDCRSGIETVADRHTVQTTDVRRVRLKSAPCCERPSIGCWTSSSSCRRQRNRVGEVAERADLLDSADGGR